MRLETQEKENQKLEEELRVNEEHRLHEEGERAKQDRWEQTMARLEQERRDRELAHKIEREELVAELASKESQLKHELMLERLRKEALQ